MVFERTKMPDSLAPSIADSVVIDGNATIPAGTVTSILSGNLFVQGLLLVQGELRVRPRRLRLLQPPEFSTIGSVTPIIDDFDPSLAASTYVFVLAVFEDAQDVRVNYRASDSFVINPPEENIACADFVNGQSSVQGQTLVIVFDVQNTCAAGGGLSAAAWAGIGVAIGVVVLGAVATIIGIILHKRRNQNSVKFAQQKMEMNKM